MKTRTPPTFDEYAGAWVAKRTISVRTRDSYRRLLTTHLLPTFGAARIGDINPGAIRDWYAVAASGTATVGTQAYSLMRSIMEGAVADDLIEVNPCQLPGISTSRLATQVPAATRAEVMAISAAMPEAYQALILMVAAFQMPFSELGELRRKDIDLVTQLVRVRRAVALVRGRFMVTTPKTREGIRDITIPPHLLAAIGTHLRLHVKPGPEALLFPSVRDPHRYLSPSVLYSMFHKARDAAGRPDLRVPDLRRSGANIFPL